jgi:hypothetical protein
VVTFPPERVMAALAPLAEPSPSIQPPQPPPDAASAPPATKANTLRRLLGFG